MSLPQPDYEPIGRPQQGTDEKGRERNPVDRLLAALIEHSALLVVRADTMAASGWLSESRLTEVIGQALMGPTDVDVWSPTSDTRVLALRFPAAARSAIGSLEIHTLCQFFTRQLNQEWTDEVGAPPEFSITPLTSLSHLEGLQSNIAELNSLLEILVNGQLTPQFQPIVSLRDGRVFAYETLIRGPKGALIRRPGQMFRVADKARIVAWFDLACLEECLKSAAAQRIRHLLFINMDAEGLAAMAVQDRPMALRVRDYGLSPANVVIEITERQTVGDFPRLIDDIRQLRELGFRIAIDDAGAGYSSLRAVSELRPDFVKIDRDLIKSIDVAGERQALLKALAQYAESTGACVVAEGAETREELAALIEIGIPYCQGYVLGRPADTLRGTPRELREHIQERVAIRENRRIGAEITVGALARSGCVVDAATPLSEVARRFAKETGLTSIAVTEHDRLLGLLLRQQFDHALAMVKAALAAEMMPAEAAAQWIRTDVLRVQATALVRDVVQQVISRQDLALDADIAIVDGSDGYVGVLSIRSLMEAAASQPVRHARYADPLTGMPGRLPLERALRERLEAQTSLAVIRLDLSDLADVNSQFGVSQGDELILAVARLITGASAEFGHKSDVLAHLGGDNFVVLTRFERANEFCQAIALGFEKAAKALCGVMSRPGAGPPGETQRPALCTISLAAITNRSRRLQTADQVMGLLRDLLRAVKSRPGNRWAVDTM